MAIDRGAAHVPASSESWWPGTEAPVDVQEMDPDVVLSVARNLQLVLDDLLGESPGGPTDLYRMRDEIVTAEAFGRWDVAAEVHRAYLDAFEKFMETYHNLMARLERAVHALTQEVEDLRATDEVSSAQVERIETGYDAVTRSGETGREAGILRAEVGYEAGTGADSGGPGVTTTPGGS